MLNRSLRLTLLTSGLLIAGAAPASAHSHFPERIPNGGAALCANCHINSNGGGVRNAFGNAFRSNGERWNATLAALDSDGDGHTNGEELGDPAGTWRPGNANPQAALISLPGDAQSTLCGDGIVNGMEACDGQDLNGATCPSEDETPRCTSDCTISCFITSPDMPPDTDIPADMPDVSDMPGVEDMPADMPSGQDSPVDLPDQGQAPPQDMGTSRPLPANDDDGGCAQVGARAPSPALAILAMLGLGLVRRRKRA